MAVRQYSEHPDGIFGTSVFHASANGYSYFLVRDQWAVEDAVRGAIRLDRWSRSAPPRLADAAALSE